MFDQDSNNSTCDFSNNFSTGVDNVVPAESNYECPSHSLSQEMYSSDSLYND